MRISFGVLQRFDDVPGPKEEIGWVS